MLMVAEENKVTGRSEGKRGGRGRETGLWTRRQETPADRLWLSCGREQSDRIVEALAEVESFWRFLRPAGQGKLEASWNPSQRSCSGRPLGTEAPGARRGPCYTLPHCSWACRAWARLAGGRVLGRSH